MSPILREVYRYRAYFAGLRLALGTSLGLSILKGAVAVLFVISLRRFLDVLSISGTINAQQLATAIILALVISLLGIAMRFAVPGPCPGHFDHQP